MICKLLTSLLLAIGLVSPVLAASPTLNGTATNSGYQGGTTSGTLTKTCSAGDVVLMAVYSERQSTPNNTTTVSGGGLTWTRVYRSDYPKGVSSPPGTTNTWGDAELWYAPAPSGISGATLTVAINNASDATEFSAICISGAFDATSPFDPNVSLPAVNIDSGGAAVTYSTSNSNDLILAFRMQSNTGVVDASPTGFTLITRAVNGSGAVRYASVESDYKSVSATQSSVSTSYPNPQEYPTMILVAITADASGPGPGNNIHIRSPLSHF